MIYNSSRSGKQTDCEGKQSGSRPGDDVRSGKFADNAALKASKITPAGAKERHIAVVGGKVRVVEG